MKILQINKYHYIKGGADAIFFNTIKLMEEHGHEVAPFSIKHPLNISSPYSDYFVNAPEIRDENIGNKFINIPKYFYNIDAARKIELLIKDFKPDIAHLHNIFNGISLSILPVLKRYKVPVVISIHDARFICPSSLFTLRGKLCRYCKKSLYTNCMFHRCYQGDFFYSAMTCLEMIHKNLLFNYNKYIDKYIFTCYDYLNLHAEQYSRFRKKGTVLYNVFPNLNETPVESRRGDYFLYYGRIVPEKGILTLVEAMKNFPDVQLKIAGTGSLMQQLLNYDADNIKLMGFVQGEELFDLIRNASFVIVPSEWRENNPLTIIESFSYGKPVIGSRISGIPELVIDDNTGWCFEPCSINALTEAINKALNISDEQYNKMSACARSFAETHFNPDIHYARLLDIYNQSIESHENI